MNVRFSFFVLLILSSSYLVPVQSAAGDNDKNAPHMKAAKEFAGSDIVAKKSCVTCHTIGANGGTVGPILNQISNRRTEDWLREWFTNPDALKPGTKMPNFQFSEKELDRLLAYLSKMKRTINSDKILSSHSDPIETGEKLFEAYDCYACHRIGNQGRFVGPNLTWIGLRKSREWETIWLTDPPAYKPGTFMPDFRLTPKEIEALTAFLHSLQGERNNLSRKWEAMTSFILDARPKERGRLVAERLACWSCHGEGLTGGIRNPNASPDEFVPAIASVYLDMDEEDLRQTILEGSIPAKLSSDRVTPFSCPPFKEALTDKELSDLLAYLESIVPEGAKWDFN